MENNQKMEIKTEGAVSSSSVDGRMLVRQEGDGDIKTEFGKTEIAHTESAISISAPSITIQESDK